MAQGESEQKEGSRGEGTKKMVCDFCGKTVSRVRRIALDRNYERLQTPHKVQYACDTCSEEKEQRRLGHKRG